MENYYNCIYCYTSPSGKKYIGQAKNFIKRHKGHISISNNVNSRAYNHQFHKAIRKYGIENFKIDILEYNIKTKQELNEKEKFYISLYDTFRNGYNSTLGGDGGNTFVNKSEKEITEIRKKTSEKNKIQVVAININNIDDIYIFDGIIDASKKLTSMLNENYESCNISRVCKYNHNQKEYIENHKTFRTKIKNMTFLYKNDYDLLSKQDIQIILNNVVINQLDRLNSDEAKTKRNESSKLRMIPIAQYDKNNNLIKIWNSGTTIQKETGINQSSIIRVCKEKQKTAGGFIWRYYE